MLSSLRVLSNRMLTRYLRYLVLALCAMLVSACGAVPVQEMSDARQAIQAARDAGADILAQEKIQQAQVLISKAQAELEAGQYDEARDSALAAHEYAQQARESAIQGGGR